MLYLVIQDIAKLRVETEAKLQEISERLAALEGKKTAAPSEGRENIVTFPGAPSRRAE